MGKGKIIVVGSTAALHRLPKFTRPGKIDYDTWGTEEKDNQDGDYSCMPESVMNSFQKQSIKDGIATLDDLMTIKLSHLPWDIFWHKHASDYLVFKILHKAKINLELYSELKEYWKIRHGTKTKLSLYKRKDEFFDDYVSNRNFDHDDIHEAVAHPDTPVYKKCLKDGEEVMIDRCKFDTMKFSEQVKMFREEMTAIAIERYPLNERFNRKYNMHRAWSLAVHKTVTALTKGWASEFICENLEYFMKPDFKHIEKSLNHLKENYETIGH